MKATRQSLYESVDHTALKPLLYTPYEYAGCKKVQVNIHYHVEIDHHYYSISYQLVKEQVEVWLATATVEILFKNSRVTSHARSCKKYHYTTVTDHMPKLHRKYREWTLYDIIRWAGHNGPNTRELVARIMENRRRSRASVPTRALCDWSNAIHRSVLNPPAVGTITGVRRKPMLNQQTIHTLYALKLKGMAEALADQLNQPDMDRLSFMERFGLIVDRQWTWKENTRLERYLKITACV